MKRLIAVLLLTIAVDTAGAQVRRRVPRVPEPSLWASLSVGLFNANGVNDGQTNSTWDFGDASNAQFRAAFEKAITSTVAAGLAATYVHAPFTYRGETAGEASCLQCAAHLDLISLGATFHVGGGIGLHQVLEASAGAVQYRNLTRDSDDASLAPLDGDIDPFFTFAYGFGYSLNPNAQVSVVQEFGLGLHQRDGLTSEQSNTFRPRTLRLNFRYGFGNRVRRTL